MKNEFSSLTKAKARKCSFVTLKGLEMTAQFGERYITRNRTQYVGLLQKALLAGLVMSLTTLVKFSILQLPVGGFVKTLLASVNYSLTFLGIHFFQFALGTKQPALTASALAARMQGKPEVIADDIIHLMRSQFGSILGNIFGVVPAIILISVVSQLAFNHQILGAEKSAHILQEFSVLGPTPMFAYFTGILLWLASVMGSRFERKHGFAIAANVSLGFLLAFVPWILGSMGLHIDARHVTLSSGALALAIMDLPSTVLLSGSFFLAVIGIFVMGFLNVVVSFGLSLVMAIRTREIQAPARKVIYTAILRKVLKNPLSVLWPEL